MLHNVSQHFTIFNFRQEHLSTLAIPVLSDLDVKCVIAPPLYLFMNDKCQPWSVPIYGLSLELNIVKDVEVFLRKRHVSNYIILYV